jgi:hypothetical protein
MKSGTSPHFIYWWYAIFIFLYLSGPIWAALAEVGDRRGPIIYPIWYHEALFNDATEMIHGYKPRIGPGVSATPRPLFYGL